MDKAPDGWDLQMCRAETELAAQNHRLYRRDQHIVELKAEVERLRKACHITCLAIEFRGKVAMGEDLLPDESNWRDGVESYLLALYNWNKEASGWAGGNMDEERWKELLGHLEKGEKDG